MDHLALVGMDVAQMQQLIQTAIGGRQVGLMYEGDKRFKLDAAFTGRIAARPGGFGAYSVTLPLDDSPELRYVPLGEIATISANHRPQTKSTGKVANVMWW